MSVFTTTHTQQQQVNTYKQPSDINSNKRLSCRTIHSIACLFCNRFYSLLHNAPSTALCILGGGAFQPTERPTNKRKRFPFSTKIFFSLFYIPILYRTYCMMLKLQHTSLLNRCILLFKRCLSTTKTNIFTTKTCLSATKRYIIWYKRCFFLFKRCLSTTKTNIFTTKSCLSTTKRYIIWYKRCLSATHSYPTYRQSYSYSSPLQRRLNNRLTKLRSNITNEQPIINHITNSLQFSLFSF